MALIPAAIFGIGLICIPESPRWLAAHGQVDNARAALKQIRDPAEVEAELTRIEKNVAEQKGNWSDLRLVSDRCSG